MSAVYDLSKMPTTYDFAAWAVMAKTEGEKHVHFIVDAPIASWKYPEDTAWKRWATVLLPICKLAGLSFSVGPRRSGREYGYHGGQVNRLFAERGRLEKLRATMKPSREKYVTITLRQSFRNKHRNSNMEAWTQFQAYLEGKGVDVAVLPECEDAPINVEHRMALYAHADMNLGVAQGPMALCIFSDAPYITLNQNPPDPNGEAQYDINKLLVKTGFPPGSQYAFRTDRQILVWEQDSFENIVAAYERMMAGGYAVERKAA